MNTRGTWWLVTAAAVLFACVVVDYRRTAKAPVGEETGILFKDLVPSQVTRVEIRSPFETARVERTGSSWQLTSPVRYPAQGRVIEAFVQSCTDLASSTTISSSDISSQPHGLADYGLQPPAATITLQQGARAFELRLGTNTPLGQSLYAQIGGQTDVKVLEVASLNAFPRRIEEWRERALVGIDGQSFNRIEVRTGSRGFAVEKEPGGQTWQMIKPPPLKRADNEKVLDIVRRIRSWPVQQFILDDPAASLAPFGLQPPVAELVIGNGTNDLFAVQFGTSPTNAPQFVFARQMAHTNVVLVPRENLDALTQNFSEFRDRRLLTFNATNATQIEMKGVLNFQVTRQTNGSWRIGEPYNIDADGELVSGLLARLQGLEIAEFEKDVVTETDLLTYGLVSPQLRVTVTAPPTNAVPGVTNIVLADLLVGTNRQVTALYARRGDEPSVYVVPLGDIQSLPQNPYALRSRTLWNFGTSNVVSVTASFAGVKRKLLRSSSGDWEFAPGFQGSFEPVAVEEMVHRLGALKAATWSARGKGEQERFGVAAAVGTFIEVELRTADGPKVLRVDFGNVSAARRPYAAAIVDGESMVFEFDPGLYGDLVSFLFPKQP